jgi:nitrate reductase / nitrite oxidoreductase, beta subunit
MRIHAQLMMVMALDKCLGCHTCSVTCKQAWTNREGADYIWFNNVETKPGIGYPKQWEDQGRWKGGWSLDGKGRLALRAGGRAKKLATIFGNLDLPTIDDYYEPWTYDYATLTSAPLRDDTPVAQAHSTLTGKPLPLKWGPNWEDNLAGVETLDDPDLTGLHEQVRLRYEQVFMFYVPRICNHCLNPSCVASCPSGAMYKRQEDGIVLVDQNKCRGWRFCVSGCPYKKVYFNHVTGKAEKCIFCYAATEIGMPTVCSETCVGRIRSIGVVLYDLDQVTAAAQTPAVTDLVEAQRALMLDPFDARVLAGAEAAGIPRDWLMAAQRSPVYALAKEFAVALPLHPEYRTVPMVWYVPPLSPVLDSLNAAGYKDGEDDVFVVVDDLRIPLAYVANILAAGEVDHVQASLHKLSAMRAFKRREQLSGSRDATLAQRVGLTPEALDRMYRLLAIANFDERYVIPKSHREAGGALQTQHRIVGRLGGQT